MPDLGIVAQVPGLDRGSDHSHRADLRTCGHRQATSIAQKRLDPLAEAQSQQAISSQSTNAERQFRGAQSDLAAHAAGEADRRGV